MNLEASRKAGAAWAATSIGHRLGVIRRMRRRLARDCESFSRMLAHRRPEAETLVAEVLPLLDAARFLERHAERLLAPRNPPGLRPLWLWGVRAQIRREALGVVLILGPSNYPLFLPGVQALQALAAGNAVHVKPAPGVAQPMRRLAALLAEAGLPDGLLTVLDESVETAQRAAHAGYDRIVLTGSAATGRSVLRAAAERLTPATMELSGCDAVFVLPGADLDLTADCLAYGLRLNGGATCIAPRRVFVRSADAPILERLLLHRVASLPTAPVPAPVLARLAALLAEAQVQGARVSNEPCLPCPPIVLADARADMRLLQEDVFAPVLSLVPVADMEEALVLDAVCPYALGASVFGPERAAWALAERVRTGSVVVNDLIVPTADPRLPFGGRGESGFGVTRGAEGLLEMTAVKAISVRHGRFRPHLAPLRPSDGAVLARLIRFMHLR